MTSRIVEVRHPLNTAVPQTADTLESVLVDTGDIDRRMTATDLTERIGVTGKVVTTYEKIVTEATLFGDIYCPPRDMLKGRPLGRPFRWLLLCGFTSGAFRQHRLDFRFERGPAYR